MCTRKSRQSGKMSNCSPPATQTNVFGSRSGIWFAVPQYKHESKTHPLRNGRYLEMQTDQLIRPLSDDCVCPMIKEHFFAHDTHKLANTEANMCSIDWTVPNLYVQFNPVTYLREMYYIEFQNVMMSDSCLLLLN